MAFVTADCTFLSGKLGKSFDCTAINGTEPLITKDSTGQIIYFHQVALCCGSAVKLAFFDGSAGNMKIAHSVPVDAGGNMNVVMNFGLDPLVFRDASNAVCVSGAADGACWGFVKYSKG